MSDRPVRRAVSAPVVAVNVLDRQRPQQHWRWVSAGGPPPLLN